MDENQAGSAQDVAEGHAVVAGAAKKAKTPRVRVGALPGVGVSAEGVRTAAAPTQKARTPDEVLAAFRGKIAPFRPSLLYRLWLLIGAGVMVLLPLIYVALIALVIAALAYHAVHDVVVFQHPRNKSSIRGAVLIYVVPLVCGALIVALMLKPLFAKRAGGIQRRTLDPQDEPLLYAFIEGVCTAVGAPRPQRIEVNSEINAAAGYSGGPFSWFARELYVVIGLGLVAGLDIKQLAGVMAHELGHIAQRSGARLTGVIWSINDWFAQVVYTRDSWDDTLQAWSAHENGYIRVIVACARAAVWLTRRVLWVLLHVGHLVNMVVIRQREFDADRYEARMVGATVFAQTSWRLEELNLAAQLAMSDLQSSWQEQRLPDNYPKLTLANVPQIPSETLEAYRKSAEQATTGFFDTHPCTRDRIAHAQAEEPRDGIFNLDGPATDVFRDFDALARLVTFDYYWSMLGPEISQDQLYPVAELVETQASVQEGSLAFDRFFLKALSTTQQFALPTTYPGPPADTHPESATPDIVKDRNDQQALRAQCLAAGARDADLYRRLIKIETAGIMQKCGVPFDPEDCGLRAATIEAAESARDLALAEVPELTAQFEPYAVAAARRLTRALALLELDTFADRVAEGRQRREEARIVYPCAAHLGGNVVSQLDPALRARKVLTMLVEIWNGVEDEPNQAVINAALRAAADLSKKLEALRSIVGDTVAYPFEHAEEDITVGRFVFPSDLPEDDDDDGIYVNQLLDVAGAVIPRLLGLYKRALGRLTVTAEEVERALGLEPIAVEDAPQG